MKEVIPFKSDPENYDPESKDLKRNTVRFTDDWKSSRWEDYWNSKIIVITNSKTGQFFSREITHKCLYKNIAIISW